MTPSWFFKPKQPDDTIREPIQGEFFATEAIRNSAEALVREAIQNSLDARQGDQKVRVRFYLSGGQKAIGPTLLKPLTHNLFDHLLAKSNGLRNAPLAGEHCRFLVVEDFGTSGLTGDVSQWRPLEGTKNDFYSFFRAEGQSDKGETARGRWGIGKFVFPRVSRASCFFALSVRTDPPHQVLMGRAILRSHDITDVTFVPDGYFGVKTAQLVTPVTDASDVEAFRQVFSLRRKTELGLSVVVPWHDDSVTTDAILTAVLRDYYFAILSDQLEVTVEDPDTSYVVNEASVAEIAERRTEVFDDELRPLLALAQWALNTKGNEIPMLQPPGPGAPTWAPEMLTAELAKKLQSTLQQGNNIALTVPLAVKAKVKELQKSHFNIYLAPATDNVSGKVTFIREGIIVTAAGGKRPAGVNALVVIEPGPLANLLGDSENPAHTEWRKDTKGLQDKYSYATHCLAFVKNSVATITRYLSEGDVSPDQSLLLDSFSLPIEEAGSVTIDKIKNKSGVKPDKPDIPPIATRPARFRLDPNKGGFVLTQGSKECAPPYELDVAIAYDLRGGNPLKNYNEADFSLTRKPITLQSDGDVAITVNEGNRFSVQVNQLPFAITVSGFDTNRDLYVRVISRNDDGDTTS